MQEFQGEDAERPKGLWGALLRKLSVKHQSEQSMALFEPKEDYHMTDEAQSVARLSNHEADIANAMISLLQSSSPGHELTTATLAEGRTSNCTGDALSGWPGGITSSDTGVWKTDRRVQDGVVHVDYLHSMEKRYFPRPLSDVDEISETESIDSPAPSTAPQQLHRPKKRVSIKVAGFVGWKKSSKKGSTTEPSPHSE